MGEKLGPARWSWTLDLPKHVLKKHAGVHQPRKNTQNVAHPDNGLSPASERKDILTPATLWLDLEGMMLSEVSQTQKAKCCVIPAT